MSESALAGIGYWTSLETGEGNMSSHSTLTLELEQKKAAKSLSSAQSFGLIRPGRSLTKTADVFAVLVRFPVFNIIVPINLEGCMHGE